MSHFTVLVVAKDEHELHTKLIPYYEYGTCEKNDSLVSPHLEWKDMVKECAHEYETESVKMVLMPDGSKKYKWDEEFRVKTDSLFDTQHKVPDHLPIVDVPHKERFSTIEEYMEDWHGLEKTDRGYGYWYNPNAKWDWYTVGGRWSGSLLLKNGKTADTAIVADIAWNKLKEKRTQEAFEHWDSVEQVLVQAESSVEEWIKASKESWDATYDRIRELEDVSASIMFSVYDINLNRAEYAKQQALTFAFVDRNGKWSQRGQMGWWGCVTDENADYNDVFWKFIARLSPTETVYVVDCHI